MNKLAWIVCLFAQIIPIIFAISAMIINTGKAHIISIVGALVSLLLSAVIDLVFGKKTKCTPEALEVFKALRY